MICLLDVTLRYVRSSITYSASYIQSATKCWYIHIYIQSVAEKSNALGFCRHLRNGLEFYHKILYSIQCFHLRLYCELNLIEFNSGEITEFLSWPLFLRNWQNSEKLAKPPGLLFWYTLYTGYDNAIEIPNGKVQLVRLTKQLWVCSQLQWTVFINWLLSLTVISHLHHDHSISILTAGAKSSPSICLEIVTVKWSIKEKLLKLHANILHVMKLKHVG